MTTIPRSILIAAACGLAAACAVPIGLAAMAQSQEPIPLKEAKLIIEHNATDHDTGFQGFLDSEGWEALDLVGPKGAVLHFEGRGALGRLGLTELFFETVEPANSDVPLAKTLADMPAGRYTYRGRAMMSGESLGETMGTAQLSHAIPAGPELLSPAKGAAVPPDGLVMRWGAVTKSLTGTPVKVIAYQLIVEKATAVHARMIGKWGLSMYLPSTVTSMAIPKGFLEPQTAYQWEVLAIEESGNQTLSSSEFSTR